MRPLLAALMCVLFMSATAYGQYPDGRFATDAYDTPLVEMSLGTEVSVFTTAVGCTVGDLPRVAPVRKTVRFFKTRKPLRRAVVAVVKAKPVCTFLKRRKPVRRVVAAAARVALFPFRRCQ